MLQLLAAAVAALAGFQRLLEQALGLHDGGGFFLGQQDVRRRTTSAGDGRRDNRLIRRPLLFVFLDQTPASLSPFLRDKSHLKWL